MLAKKLDCPIEKGKLPLGVGKVTKALRGGHVVLIKKHDDVFWREKKMARLISV